MHFVVPYVVAAWLLPTSHPWRGFGDICGSFLCGRSCYCYLAEHVMRLLLDYPVASCLVLAKGTVGFGGGCFWLRVTLLVCES